MPLQQIAERFIEAETSIVHQDGTELTEPVKGVEIVLHTRAGETDPCCAEVIAGDLVAEIGLTFRNKELVDFDGVFFLPRVVGQMLTARGYTVPSECFA